MPTVVGIALRNAASPVLFDPAGVEMNVNDTVVVHTERGTELGRVAAPVREKSGCDSPCQAVAAENRVIRVATEGDMKVAEELHLREREAMSAYRRLIAKHKLDMKPTDVEFLFDGQRAIFYFVSEERVDFRELVRDLAAEFHIRIDMRQIGVRDEARLVGGLGHCGEQLCCVRFGGEFQPVSIRMAKEQDLPLNPLKISGLCGRLMCCLRYEYDAYKDFKGRAPKKGAIVDVGGDLAKVVELDTPRERITMRKEDGSRVTFPLADMDCGSACASKGCACSVKTEAIERSLASSLIDLSSSSVVQPRERKLRESKTREAVVAPSSTEAAPQLEGEAPSGGKRRRRRRGGSSAAAAPAEATEAPAAQKSGRRQPKPPARKAAPKADTAPAADSGAPKSDAPKRRRRRRRAGGGAAGGEPTGGTGS